MKLNIEGTAPGKEETTPAREQERRGCDILSVIRTGAGLRGAALHGSHHDGCVGGAPLQGDQTKRRPPAIAGRSPPATAK